MVQSQLQKVVFVPFYGQYKLVVRNLKIIRQKNDYKENHSIFNFFFIIEY